MYEETKNKVKASEEQISECVYTDHSLRKKKEKVQQSNIKKYDKIIKKDKTFKKKQKEKKTAFNLKKTFLAVFLKRSNVI